MTSCRDRFVGALLGTAVGDALGLPFERMPGRRTRRILGKNPLRHRFLFGFGMVSDDTEHTCMLAEALLEESSDPRRFSRALARKLKLWLLAGPVGIGRATLLGILRLWLGRPPERSGVFSAGNGPAMRAALLGLRLGDDPATLRAFTRASTKLTHSDPKAERGALAVALAASHGFDRGPDRVDAAVYSACLRNAVDDPDEELLDWIEKLESSVARRVSVADFAETLGCRKGVSGYVYHTVPVAVFAWLRYPADFTRAIDAVVRLGGDTDTVAAICGALIGATVGEEGLPQDLVAGVRDWPCSVGYMRRLGTSLSGAVANPGDGRFCPSNLRWLLAAPRNLVFFSIVLAHLVRRAAPPW